MMDLTKLITAQDKLDKAALELREAANREAREYLTSTDWLVIRELETGIPAPASIRTSREAARAKVIK